ncbi:MAG TPA: coniferyl aldehyde dehydrogenase, partial [Ramlibacter sp.]
MDLAAGPTAPTATQAPAAELQARFHAQRRAFAADSFPDAATRRDRLQRMRRLVEENEQRFAGAICADFGNRSRHETVIAETFFVLAGISHTRRHLAGWMKKRRVGTSFHSLPGRSWILPQPLGVVGVV